MYIELNQVSRDQFVLKVLYTIQSISEYILSSLDSTIFVLLYVDNDYNRPIIFGDLYYIQVDRNKYGGLLKN